MEIENLNLQKQIDELKEWKDNWLDTVYPIGSIYISINSTNPENIFGGAWMPWGSGRVPVGVNSSDSDFNTVEKTGGNKSSSHTHTTGNHTLTISEMPSHNHMTNEEGGATLISDLANWQKLGQGSVNVGRADLWNRTSTIGGGKPHNHGNTGSSSVNNLQPYITCYMWKRVEPVFLFEWTDSDGEHSEEVVPNYEQDDYGLRDKIGNAVDSANGDISLLKLSSFGVKLESCKNIFSGTSNNINTVIKFDVSDLNTKDTIDMSYMFSTALYAVPKLQEIILTNLNTANVINMSGMFSNKRGLTTLDLSSFNTQKVTNMSNMFNHCDTLTSLDLSSFYTSNVTNMSYMFYYCSRLTSLDISNFDFSNVTSSNNMFSNVPANCLIYVKDQTAKNFVLGVRSDLTNIQIKS